VEVKVKVKATHNNFFGHVVGVLLDGRGGGMGCNGQKEGGCCGEGKGRGLLDGFYMPEKKIIK
jgi:hypothetical protein